MQYTMVLRARLDTEHHCNRCGEAITPGRVYAAGKQDGAVVRHHYRCSWLGLLAAEEG